MLILVVLLSFSLIQTSFAAQEDVYEVKRGEVWDWHDVLKKSEHYRGWAGIGLDRLVARLPNSSLEYAFG